MPPNRRRAFKVNLHAPTSEHTTIDESLLGALGIPELMPPNRRRAFKVKGKIMIILVGAGIILGILFMVWFRGRQKKLREEKFQANKKVREDSLKQALANQLEPEADMEMMPYRPYKVNYSTGEKQENKEKLPLLQIIEKSKLSEKKYIFRANETVILGEQFGSAGILSHPGNGNAWCEIFFQKDAYCVRSLGKFSVSVQRSKNMAIVDGRGIKLKSKDSIKIQESVFQVFYLKG